MRKGTVPSIQASLPPNVYKSIFNADSPRKQNILTNSVADSTLPDESALYQSAMDTSLLPDGSRVSFSIQQQE